MSVQPRRTQRERREATIGKLLDATIDCLVEHGYRDTSIGRICERAGVSHGGLFRHFSSRIDLLAAVTDEVGKRHIAQLQTLVIDLEPTEDMVDSMVRFFRQATREPVSAAWREVIVACRTDPGLREAVAPAVHRFEDAIMTVAQTLSGRPEGDREFGTLILSMLHMFDSEATTIVIFETDDVEAFRHDWAVQLLRSALARS